MPGKLLTIAEIAKQLDIPESTARFYRDRFEAFVPSVGEGRKKRYLPEAAEVLRFMRKLQTQRNRNGDRRGSKPHVS
ncbi:MerR family transcriptional regulator [Brevibacillus thermoruber]|uniref:MerR family transcriptional regulator n=1 Tax=Brevibacillus thermoruber TaxID=33942 RepID=UPI0009E0274E